MADVEQLVTEHTGWLMRLANRYCDNSVDASDLASETIYRLLKYRTRYNTTRDFKPWAKTIMSNIYITEYNRRKCVPFLNLDEDCHYASNDTESHVSVKILLSVIRACSFQSIAIECVLLYAKGYNYDEIGSLVGIPVGTVKSRISNGRKMLRTALEV
jgi:RNA polymerase sigma-70 factor (ECF subfamily)